MNKFLIYCLAAVCGISSVLTSCNTVKNANNTQKGAGIGVAAGALLGGIIGNNIGKGGKCCFRLSYRSCHRRRNRCRYW